MTEHRFFALPDNEVDDIYQRNDVVYIDYTSEGKLCLTFDQGVDYYRPLFMLEKGFVDANKDNLYVGKLIWSARMIDGGCQYIESIETVDTDPDVMTTYLNVLKDTFLEEYEIHKDNGISYYQIKKDGVWYGDIDLDSVLPEECTEFWIIGTKTEKVEVK